MYLLDTNFVSELRREDRLDPGVRDWAARARLEDAWLSAITVFEIELGVLRKERRDKLQGRELRLWFEELLHSYRNRILPVDSVIARTTAMLYVPDPRPHADALIAATAIVHDLTLVTRNTRDFTGMGVRLLNPWGPGA